jgi:hypothetical protein
MLRGFHPGCVIKHPQGFALGNYFVVPSALEDQSHDGISIAFSAMIPRGLLWVFYQTISGTS